MSPETLLVWVTGLVLVIGTTRPLIVRQRRKERRTVEAGLALAEQPGNQVRVAYWTSASGRTHPGELVAKTPPVQPFY